MVQKLSNQFNFGFPLYQSQHHNTVEPRYNDPRYNAIPGITINMLHTDAFEAGGKTDFVGVKSSPSTLELGISSKIRNA